MLSNNVKYFQYYIILSIIFNITAFCYRTDIKNKRYKILLR